MSLPLSALSDQAGPEPGWGSQGPHIVGPELLHGGCKCFLEYWEGNSQFFPKARLSELLPRGHLTVPLEAGGCPCFWCLVKVLLILAPHLTSLAHGDLGLLEGDWEEETKSLRKPLEEMIGSDAQGCVGLGQAGLVGPAWGRRLSPWPHGSQLSLCSHPSSICISSSS